MNSAEYCVALVDRLWANMWAMVWPMTLCVLALYTIERCWRELSPIGRSWLWRLFFIKCALGLMGVTLIDTSWLATQLPQRDHASTLDGLAPPASGASVPATRWPNQWQAIAQFSLTLPKVSLDDSWRSTLLIGWLLGIAIGATLMVGNYARLANIVWHSQRALPMELAGAYRRLAVRLKVRRPPELRLVTMLAGPALTFCGRTHVLVPKSFADTYGADAVDMAIAHELAHWSRRDIFWNWMASAIGLVFFFVPPMWLALRRYRLAQEMACDAWALRRGRIEPADYAGLLLEVVERTAARRSAAALPIVSLSLARTESFRTLKERLNAMKPTRSSIVARLFAGCLLLSTSLGLVLPWTDTARGQERSSGRAVKSQLPLGGQGNYATPAPTSNSASASAFGFSQAFGSASGSSGGYSGGGSRGFVAGGGFAAVGTPNNPTSSSANNSSGSMLAPLQLPNKPIGQFQFWNNSNMPKNSSGASVSTASQVIDGEKLTVTTVLDKQREITIRQSDSEGVEVRIRQRGKKAAVETFTADSLAELEQDAPAIFKQIEPYLATARAKSDFDANDKPAPLPGPGEIPKNPAETLMRDQLKQLRDQAAGNEQLQNLIDQMLQRQ